MFKEKMNRWGQGLKAFEESPAGKRAARVLSFLFTGGIVIFLVYQLSGIGWKEVWSSLPRTPWFYVLFIPLFFTLPVFQVMIYRVAWKVNRFALFLALLNKRALDKDVLGYSGEMYLYVWARKHIKKPERELLHVLKDNMILSSTASTLVAVILLGIFFIMGRVALPEEWVRPGMLHVLLAVFAVLLVTALAVKFRKSLFFLSWRQLAVIFSLHICRLLVVQGLQVLQWMVVMPEVPVVNWFTLLAVQIIISRIPLVPSRDLIFLGTGIGMSGIVEVSVPEMAGMLLTASVLSKVSNVIFFAIVYFTSRKRWPKEARKD